MGGFSNFPHSKTNISDSFKADFVDIKIAEKEIELLTDFATDEIFNIVGTSKVVFPYSRVFCDVERLDDDNEVIFKYGRGFYYTKTDSGESLRNDSNGNKNIIHSDYYSRYHETLTNMVDQKLKDLGFALIVDCHSFSDKPFNSDIEQGSQRPDFLYRY